ncbi:MAG: ISC system 2Fe-2S type ferredoxin [Burkholderiales bacterium]|jgi:2Fe-2S ferredoxin|nr:ISC system 2Fe-2S type ferredoxin [Burkholderiales bacterium]
MPEIYVHPHPELCPNGARFHASPGAFLLDVLLDHGIKIGHACERACACSTCHVIVKQGFNTLNAPSEDEEDALDHAWGLTPTSRLSCQARVGNEAIEIELPRYSINLAKENE